MNLKIDITSIAHHRNGISGEPFCVILFWDRENNSNMVGIVFPLRSGNFYNGKEWNGRVTVLDVDKLAKGDIEFGSNSWRGDVYETALREALKELD